MKNKNPVKLSCSKINGKESGFNIVFLADDLFKATYPYVGSGAESPIPLLQGSGITIITKNDESINSAGFFTLDGVDDSKVYFISFADTDYCADRVYPFEDE